MKKLILITSVLVSVISARAQITLDTTINNSLYLGYGFKLVQISKDETKWYFCDTLNNTFSLYNMDFTPFITSISVPEPFAPYVTSMQVLYITRSLFDCDSTNIEYAYYAPLDATKPFRIVRTDGTILFQKDSAVAPYLYGATLGGTDVIRPIVNTSSGAKLFLQKYPTVSTTYVYSLCGTLPTDVFDFKLVESSFVKVFPNPASNSLNFQIQLPDNINEYELVIFDADATEMFRKKINPHSSNFPLDVANLSGGAYFYSLSSKSKSYQSGKFLITK